MRFTVVGAGALGTILSVHLAAAGHEVRTVARGARAEVLRTEGMNLRGLRDVHIPCLRAVGLSREENNGVIIYDDCSTTPISLDMKNVIVTSLPNFCTHKSRQFVAKQDFLLRFDAEWVLQFDDDCYFLVVCTLHVMLHVSKHL